MHKVTAFMCSCNTTACTPISGLVGHDQEKDTHIYQAISGSGSRFPQGGWEKTQIVAEFGVSGLFIYWDYLFEKAQKSRIPGYI